jgi:hypothetical protein
LDSLELAITDDDEEGVQKGGVDEVREEGDTVLDFETFIQEMQVRRAFTVYQSPQRNERLQRHSRDLMAPRE